MADKRVSLYDRLPEIYKIKDEEQNPPGQLKAYLELVETAFGEIHENIESLYDDLFIEFCDDWVIPYIGDLLGASHLSGVPWTLRADVADTIALRRRKGTIGAIELLTYNLTRWGVHCVELLENMVWNQHLNHQRPDMGGKPPYATPDSDAEDKSKPSIYTVIRGGTVTLRDPAMLSLLNSPFDPFAHTANVKPDMCSTIQYNLPNLAIFLWRLKAYRVVASEPVSEHWHLRDPSIDTTIYPNAAERIVRFHVHPLGYPVRLFNTYRFDPDKKPPEITRLDQVPGPIPMARLSDGSEAGNPESYVTYDPYDPTDPTLETIDISDVGLIFHLPVPEFLGSTWKYRGADLCDWENNINPPLDDNEIAIDPVLGRVIFGVETEDEANALEEYLLVTYTYGAVGPVGAHPESRPPTPTELGGNPVEVRKIDLAAVPSYTLSNALDNIDNSPKPIVIEIHDNCVHDLDLENVAGILEEPANMYNLQLNYSLVIRAADNCRPIIRLIKPLRFRPKTVHGIDSDLAYPIVRLEGLYITNDDADQQLITRAALNRLEVIDCTLDPGGYRQVNNTRSPVRTAMLLTEPYGFDSDQEEDDFDQTPEIYLQRTITGPLLIDTGYKLTLNDTIVDAGSGVSDDAASAEYAISGASGDPSNVWGPPTQFNGLTVFGQTRVESIFGGGAVFVHSLQVLNNQKGCIKFSYLLNINDETPQIHGCVLGPETKPRFTSDEFGHYAYAQLALSSDFRILEGGPGRTELDAFLDDCAITDDANYSTIVQDEKVFKLGDQMGAFGFLLEAHKWRNIRIRYREFMPIGIKPLLIPVT